MFSMFSRHTNQRNGGFSLLEIFGAITLLMAGLVAFAGVFLSTTRMTDRTRENNLVTITLRNAVETLEATEFTTLVTEFGTGSPKEDFWCEDDGALLFVCLENIENMSRLLAGFKAASEPSND